MQFRDIAAVLVTRGDVDLQPILDSLPYPEVVVWDNSTRPFDAKVFGRYLAILETSKPVIYIQDDDCVVHCHDELRGYYEPGRIVANMVTEHRAGEPPMLGWGALFDRDLPWGAFEKWLQAGYPMDRLFVGYPETIFTALVPCIRLNIGSHTHPETKGHTDLPWATAPSRSYRQRNHASEFALVLERALALAEGKVPMREIYMREYQGRRDIYEKHRIRQ